MLNLFLMQMPQSNDHIIKLHNIYSDTYILVTDKGVFQIIQPTL
jgi:hypothetical protein